MATVTLTSAQMNNPNDGVNAAGTTVQSVINAASSGDTINFPSGTWNWSPSTTVSVAKSLNLIGTGPSSCKIQNQLSSGIMLNIVSQTDGHIRLSGIYFTQIPSISTSLNNTAVNFGRSDTLPPGPGNQYTVIVTNCTFDSGGHFIYSAQVGSNGLIFSNCTFPGGGLAGLQITCGYGTEHWNTPDTMGLGPDDLVYNGIGNGYQTIQQNPSGVHLNVGDTAQGYMGYAGLNCTYIEDCTISNGSSGACNADGCARVAMRHCTFIDALPFGHGQDSSFMGHRHHEVYNCNFYCADGTGAAANDNAWVSCRGAVVLIANNTMAAITQAGGKTSIQLSCEQVNLNIGPGACQTAYPANRQCGIGWSSASSATYGTPVVTADATGAASDPIFIWGNTGTGGSGYANYVGLNFIADQCGHGLNVGQFIQQNRDYFVEVARPGWVPYTYPHPLVAGTVSTATPTLVQHVASGMDCNGVTNFITPLPNAAGAGNLLVLGIQYSSTATGITVTDNKSNAWTLATSATNTANAQKMAVYYAPNVAAGTLAVTATFTGISSNTLNVGTQAVLSEFYNVAISSPVDGTPVSSSTSLSPGSITTTAANDLIYYWAVDIQSFKDAQVTGALGGGFYNGTSITPGSGFTLLSADLQVGSTDSYSIQATAGAVSPTSTVAPTGKVWASIAVAFKSASAGTVPTQAMRILNVQHTLVGSLTTGSTAAPIPLQFPSAGNLLVGTWNGPGSFITGVSDNNSNVWSFPASTLISSPFAGQVVYAQAAKTGSNLSGLKLTLNANTFQSILVLYDIIGAATTAVLSNATKSSGSQGSTGNLTTSTITPGNSNGVVICVSPISFGTVQDLSPSGTNYISDIVCNTANNDNPGVGSQNSTLDEDNAYGHVYNTSAAPLTFVWKMTSTSGPAEGWVTVAAAFAAAGGGGPTLISGTVFIK